MEEEMEREQDSLFPDENSSAGSQEVSDQDSEVDHVSNTSGAMEIDSASQQQTEVQNPSQSTEQLASIALRAEPDAEPEPEGSNKRKREDNDDGDSERPFKSSKLDVDYGADTITSLYDLDGGD